MLGKGYWAIDRHYIEVTNDKHIEAIIKNPKIFGLTDKIVTDVFKKHKEKVGTEGNAREELIIMASKSGAIRVRHYLKPDYWSVQFDEWKKRRKDIKYFIEWAVLDAKIMGKYETVVLHGYVDDYYKTYDYMEDGIAAFLKEHSRIGLLSRKPSRPTSLKLPRQR